jgi:hypothetical protein
MSVEGARGILIDGVVDWRGALLQQHWGFLLRLRRRAFLHSCLGILGSRSRKFFGAHKGMKAAGSKQLVLVLFLFCTACHAPHALRQQARKEEGGMQSLGKN